MSEIILPRRKFLMGMAGLFAAPAIVRVESLMPVKSLKYVTGTEILARWRLENYYEEILTPMMMQEIEQSCGISKEMLGIR